MPDNPEIDRYWAGSLDTRLEALSRFRQADAHSVPSPAMFHKRLSA